MAKARHVHRSPGGARGSCLAGLMAALAGCTDPTFVSSQDAAAGGREGREEEAGAEREAGGPVVDDPEADADVATGSEARAPGEDPEEDASASAEDAGLAPSGDGGAGEKLPAWALALVGTYAKRSITFSYDDDDPMAPTNTRNEDHSIVKISRSGDELRVSIQPCYFSFVLPRATDLPLLFKDPKSYPPLSGRILLGDTNRFSSETMVSHLGFEPARGKDCTNGRRPRYEDQASWLNSSSTCQCYAGAVPESYTDCRVSDTDGDKKAGITALNPGFLSGRYSEVSIVYDFALTFTEGELKPGGRVELQEVRAQSQACLNALADLCDVGKNQLCPGGSSKLIRLSEEVTDAGCEAFPIGQFGPPDPWPVEKDCRAK